MKLDEIKKKNPNYKIYDINNYKFKDYGKLLDLKIFSSLTFYEKFMENKKIPDEGNEYVANVNELINNSFTKEVQNIIYGEMPIQVGYCIGNNSKLNGLEYHKGSEVIITITDLILMLGKVQDIVNDKYESNKIDIFYIPKGKIIELYQTTLHFSPCRVDKKGFKSIIILPKGTNLPLNNKTINKKDKLLFAKNKWLIIHPSNKRLIEKGAASGIVGENIEINL